MCSLLLLRRPGGGGGASFVLRVVLGWTFMITIHGCVAYAVCGLWSLGHAVRRVDGRSVLCGACVCAYACVYSYAIK